MGAWRCPRSKTSRGQYPKLALSHSRPHIRAPPTPAWRMSLTARVLAALVSGLAVGVAIAWSKSPALLSVASAVEPIGALWVNAIRMTVLPLVVPLLFTGIASSSGHNIGRMGGRAVAWFVGLVAAGALLTAIVAPPLLSLADLDSAAFASLREGTSTAAIELPRFRDWIVNLIPSNPVRAAADGAMLPLIVFTAIFALAATRLESAHRDTLVDAFTAVAGRRSSSSNGFYSWRRWACSSLCCPWRLGPAPSSWPRPRWDRSCWWPAVWS